MDDQVLVRFVKHILFSHTPFLFSPSHPFPLSPSLPYPSPFFFFLGQPPSTVTQPLCPGSPGPWIVTAALSLASSVLPSIRHSMIYSSHRVSFHQPDPDLATPLCHSFQYSHHTQSSLWPSPWPTRLCVNCFLANSLTRLPSALSLTLLQPQRLPDCYWNFPSTFQLCVLCTCSSLSLQISVEFILTSSGLCPHVTLSERPSLMTLHKITPPITLNPPFRFSSH